MKNLLWAYPVQEDTPFFYEAPLEEPVIYRAVVYEYEINRVYYFGRNDH